MKTKMLLFSLIAFILLLIQSCIPSLHPLYTSDDLVFDTRLIGEWMDSDSILWKFEKFEPSNSIFPSKADRSRDDFYKLTVMDEKPAVFHVHLLRLEQHLYLDFYIKDYEVNNDMADLHLFPVHTFARIKIDNNQVQMEQFNIEFIENLIKEKKVKIKHEVSYGNLILTAGTDELQKFVTKYANHEDMYVEDPIVLNRTTS